MGSSEPAPRSGKPGWRSAKASEQKDRSRLLQAIATLAVLVCLLSGSGLSQDNGGGQGKELTPPVLRTGPPRPTPQQPLKKETGTLRIAAAADLQPVLPAIATEFEKATGARILVSYASSSTLATQIIQGGPFDLFLSADYTFPELVVAKGFADSMEPTPYAQGTLALWARKDSPMQPITMEKLSSPALKKLAIADQAHAPYGRAAYAALGKIKLLSLLGSRLVIAENVAQAAQFAESGNADAAIISLTLAKSDHFRDLGSYVLVPRFDYPPLRQCAVVMKNSPNREEAHAFLRYLVSDAVVKQLANQGLGPPQ